ncbi:hypothetical protein [Vibrio japonicus]|uniref:Uncharacterized protein n=1 Tax=Vibrio japonicus TaxID=1824638 RepID=A0ABY5LP55_9VIBR|nr:hypothetical protein [Vibrio japonicus]UUM32633.1 hypothetical protein NP165_13770 [Vibrio japonicus]
MTHILPQDAAVDVLESVFGIGEIEPMNNPLTIRFSPKSTTTGLDIQVLSFTIDPHGHCVKSDILAEYQQKTVEKEMDSANFELDLKNKRLMFFNTPITSFADFTAVYIEQLINT